MKYFLLAIILAGTMPSAIALDNKTKNKVRVMYFSAEDAFQAGRYEDALQKIQEMEQVMGGSTVATAQNLKVKTLVSMEKMPEAREELDKLYGMNTSVDIMKDMARYTYTLEELEMSVLKGLYESLTRIEEDSSRNANKLGNLAVKNAEGKLLTNNGKDASQMDSIFQREVEKAQQKFAECENLQKQGSSSFNQCANEFYSKRDWITNKLSPTYDEIKELIASLQVDRVVADMHREWLSESCLDMPEAAQSPEGSKYCSQ